MNILNVEERKELQAGHYNSPAQFFDAIEAAVIKRLAAGVSVEPSFFNVMDGKTAYIPYYTPKQFTTAIAAARVQENERCLALMDAIGCDWRDAGDMAKFYATNYLREAIRALLGKESKTSL